MPLRFQKLLSSKQNVLCCGTFGFSFSTPLIASCDALRSCPDEAHPWRQRRTVLSVPWQVVHASYTHVRTRWVAVLATKKSRFFVGTRLS